MKNFVRRSTSISVFLMLIAGAYFISCKISFADAKHPEKGSIAFGSKEKPAIKISPDFQAFKIIFADIAEKVVPSVVSVIPTQIDTVVFTNNPFYQFFGEDPFGGESPFEQFFGAPQQQPRGRQRQQRQQQQRR